MISQTALFSSRVKNNLFCLVVIILKGNVFILPAWSQN